MTDLNKEREAFEGKFPKPHWIEWDEELGQYTSKHVSDVGYQARFEVWLEAKAQAVPEWISAEVGRPIKFGTRVKIKRKAWDEDDNLIIVESEATYDKDSDFCELSNRSYEYETWFDHELKKYLDEDELTHWAPLDKSESGAEG
ncbi:hypothetical protein [Acinetobacter baumannii]|uniref:hypothetical protein n=1 Tax=Acinetobacter baumannii TaxID=470 RepID=UPI003891E255